MSEPLGMHQPGFVSEQSNYFVGLLQRLAETFSLSPKGEFKCEISF